MKLTPLDIKKQEFKRTLRGYDPIEVDAFLEMVADEFEATIREKNQLADEVLKLRTQLQDYQQVEKTLKETLVNAQENVSAFRQTSQREADLIVREAELKAEKILENARMKLEQLKNDILLIKAQKESFARRLRHLLESQIELIHVLEMDDVGFDEKKKSSEKRNHPESADQEKRDSNSVFERKKVEVPLRRSSSPLVREATNRLAREDEGGGQKDANKDNPAASKSKEAAKGNEKLPRISDQFIT